MNIAEILKDCPKGTKLYSPICGECELVEVNKNKQWITVKDNEDIPTSFYANGTQRKYGECMLFPSKDNRDWNTFQRPFNDGDILVSSLGNPFIFKKLNEFNNSVAYCALNCYDGASCIVFDTDNWTEIKGCRLATEEEKQKLFDAIKENGYRWNPETKTLEPKFKNGDVVVSGAGNIALFSHTANMYDKPIIYYHCILTPIICSSDLNLEIGIDYGIGGVEDCYLASDKQKERLFNALKEKGYKWNPETKTLEKLFIPKFKVGDRIKGITEYIEGIITEITPDDFYKVKYGNSERYINISIQDRYELVNKPRFKVGDRVKSIYNNHQYDIKELTDTHYTLVEVEYKFKYTEPIIEDKNWELVPNKFDITTLKPFESRVLVRDASCYNWEPDIFGRYSDGYITLGGAKWNQCIPYEGNEHLSGTTNDCDEYYKNW